MKSATRIASIAAAAAFLWTSSPARAAETCGDMADNDDDDLVDEGCYPAGVTGICESPIDCAKAGFVAPKTGALVYHVAPDVAPTVAYGPPLVFQRYYMSKYAPGVSFPSYKAPLGNRWLHNYVSFLEEDTVPSPDEVFVHLVTGQEVMFTYDQASGGYDYYTPQTGFFIDYLRKDANGVWELRTLTGTVYEYASSGKLVKIKDGVGKYLAIAYNGDGQVDTVTDATGRKRLSFEYESTGSELLKTVNYQTDSGSGFSTYLAVAFTFSSDNLDLVKFDNVTVADYDYTSGYLTAVKDGEGTPNTLASFAYSAETGFEGSVVLVQTPEGDVGYEYTASGCDSGNGTYVTFQRASATACDVDNDCGTGEYCGGETNTAGTDTGTCFKARRCLTINSANEDLVDAVSASCDSCLMSKDYTWETGQSGESMLLDGVQSADNIWTSYERNSDGLVTKMVEADTDADASTAPAGSRVTYYFYGDSSFPGLVTEIRRKSDLVVATGCDTQTTGGCKRTVYTYTTGGLVDTVVESGFTYNNARTVTSFSYTTDHDYDSNGRLTKIAGPRSTTDDIEFTYHSGTGLSGDYLNERKLKKDATTYITTTFNAYDEWGNAGRVTDPNSKSVCYVYDDDYNRITSRRQVIDGSHTDCSSSGSGDEEYTYAYDTARRLTLLTKPESNCMSYAYDSEGRLSSVTEKRYVSSSCGTTARSIHYTYSIDGLVTKVEWKDRLGTVKKEQEYTYYTDRRIEKVINPVSTSYHKKWYYDNDGVAAKLEMEDFSSSDAKTEWDVDDLNRTTKIRRYTTSTENEEWTLTQAANLFGLPTDISDEASHDIDLVWDDLGRKVSQITEEGGTTTLVYDEAGNLTEKIEDDGGNDEQTTSYTYDALGRLTKVDTGDAECGQSGGEEIIYTYDALPSGASCPTGSTCNLLSGRLSHVKVVMWCDAGEADETFDQETFYSYDAAGRIDGHTVQDDGGRLAEVEYYYDKNSNPLRIVYPPGYNTQAKYVYDMADGDDFIREMMRANTGIVNSINWEPWGGLKSYRQTNTFYYGGTGKYVSNFYTNNKAGRVDRLYSKSSANPPDNVLDIDIAEDVRGRYTQRDFSYGSAGLRDMFFLYDDLSRATCRRTTTGSTCPTSGTDLGINISYNSSGDRSSFTLRNGVYTDQQFDVTYTSSTSDQINYITKTTGSCGVGGPACKVIDYAWDGLGRRTSDDDDEWEGPPDYDRRVYTYDGRNNLATVAGEYYTGSAWHTYTVSYAYDERNRLIFKSFVDEDATCGSDPCEAQYFFYWDQYDRLIQVKHTPDITDTDTYSLFHWYWIQDRPFLYIQTDYPNATETKRYIHSDEQNRPIAAWDYVNYTTTTTRVWEVDPGVFGWDEVTVGSSIYQPIRFAGQLYDEDTEAFDSSANPARPGLAYNRYRTYDSFVGGYIELDPRLVDTADPYTYASNNPIMNSDPDGELDNTLWECVQDRWGDIEEECCSRFSYSQAMTDWCTGNITSSCTDIDGTPLSGSCRDAVDEFMVCMGWPMCEFWGNGRGGNWRPNRPNYGPLYDVDRYECAFGGPHNAGSPAEQFSCYGADSRGLPGWQPPASTPFLDGNGPMADLRGQ